MKKQSMTDETKYYCIDLFAGCGGLSLGLEQAGFTPLLFSEINESAAKTYKANREKGIIQIGDIYSYDDRKIAGHLAEWKKEGIKGNVLGKAILRPKGYNLNKMARS